MKHGIHLLGAVVFLLILGASAQAQSMDFNQLCIHNGGDYWINSISPSPLELGGGKYYPSFTHWSAKGVGSGSSAEWPWQIRGWAWTGQQVKNTGPTWIWQTCLQESRDFPNASTMTWPYPINYVLGVSDTNGPPSPLHSTILPTTLKDLGGSWYLYPSSMGGHDAYFNIFATVKDTWIIPSTVSEYSYIFSIVIPAASAITVPSNSSIYEFVWEDKGPYGQYLILSGDEMDCTGAAGGNKGKSYSVGMLVSSTGPELYYFPNSSTGSQAEWAMGLFVNDAVTVPVNKPGVKSPANPYESEGFDVGVATLTPNVSSDSAHLMLMTNDYANPGTSRILLAASPWSGPAFQFGPEGTRMPHAWDAFSVFFSMFTWIWQHNVEPGYPAPLYGTTSGGHSVAVKIPNDPILVGIELRICGFSYNGREPSASYMMTLF